MLYKERGQNGGAQDHHRNREGVNLHNRGRKRSTRIQNGPNRNDHHQGRRINKSSYENIQNTRADNGRRNRRPNLIVLPSIRGQPHARSKHNSYVVHYNKSQLSRRNLYEQGGSG